MRRQLDKLAVVVSRATQALGPERGTARAVALASYLTERATMERYGRPLAEDAFLSTAAGPMGAKLQELIMAKGWPTLAANSAGALSPAENQIIDEVIGRFGQLDEVGLMEFVRMNCPEWKDPKNKIATPLALEDIWRALGESEEHVQALAERRRESNALQRTRDRIHTLGVMPKQALEAEEAQAI